MRAMASSGDENEEEGENGEKETDGQWGLVHPSRDRFGRRDPLNIQRESATTDNFNSDIA